MSTIRKIVRTATPPAQTREEGGLSSLGTRFARRFVSACIAESCISPPKTISLIALQRQGVIFYARQQQTAAILALFRRHFVLISQSSKAGFGPL
jgi:hypothetical protein